MAKESGEPPRKVKPERPKQVHKRHTRKYAEGDLGKDLSFYFRGPDGCAQSASAESHALSADRATAWTSAPGCITCGAATIPAGFGM